MKDFVLILLSIIIIGILGIYIFKEIPEYNKIKKELKAVELSYDSLLASKQRVDTIRDTIRDSIKIYEFKPYKVYDTVYLDTTYKAHQYKDSIITEEIKINYDIFTFGALRSLKIDYDIIKETVIKENIVYIDKVIKEPVWYPKRHLYAYGSIGSDLRYFDSGIMYNTKKQIGYKVGVVWWQNKEVLVGGLTLKIF